jgi:serine-type D-Ala-D-Ala carboxypeptidase/endopeptidase (penicillin-binding protein 4)
MRQWIRAAALSVAITSGAHAIAQPAPTPPAVTLPNRLDALVNDARFRGWRIGVFVADASTGRALYEHDADLSLNPASNAKVLTAAVALSVLGPSRRFATTLHGDLRGVTLAGPLILRGQGDPSLRASDLFELAQQLAGRGVRRIDGDVVVDDGEFGVEHLPPAFDQRPRETAPFRAAVSALSVDENALTIEARPGATDGSPAQVFVSPVGYVEVDNALTTGGDAPTVSITSSVGDGGRERLRISGTIPRASGAVTARRRIENPSLATGHVLRAMLAAAGIRVRGTVRVAPGSSNGITRLAEHQSAPLSSLLYEVGKDSNNFYAEMMLLAISAASARDTPGPTTFARGVERVLRWAREHGVTTDGLTVRNGSGLYDANRLSARQLTQVMRACWRDPAIREEYLAQFAVSGDDGTLRTRLRLPGHPRVVRAKTGTLDDVIALSGFVTSPDPARVVTFSFVVNGVHGRAAEARQLADDVVTRLVEDLDAHP